MKETKQNVPDFSSKSKDYLKGLGISLDSKTRKISLSVKDENAEVEGFMTITSQDFDFAYYLDLILSKAVTAIMKTTNYTLFLQAMRYIHSINDAYLPLIIKPAMLLVDETRKQVKSGKYKPTYGYGDKKNLTSDTYTKEWLHKLAKFDDLVDSLKIQKAMYFGKGYVNYGTVDYSITGIGS